MRAHQWTPPSAIDLRDRQSAGGTGTTTLLLPCPSPLNPRRSVTLQGTSHGWTQRTTAVGDVSVWSVILP